MQGDGTDRQCMATFKILAEEKERKVMETSYEINLVSLYSGFYLSIALSEI